MKRAMCGLLAVLASGCAMLDPYVPPAAGPRAGMRLYATGFGAPTIVVAAAGPGCVSGLHAAHVATLAAGPGAADTSIEAERSITLQFQTQGRFDGWYSYGCAAAVTFVPRAGEEYQARFSMLDPRRCDIELARLEPDRRGNREPAEARDARFYSCGLKGYVGY